MYYIVAFGIQLHVIHISNLGFKCSLSVQNTLFRIECKLYSQNEICISLAADNECNELGVEEK